MAAELCETLMQIPAFEFLYFFYKPLAAATCPVRGKTLDARSLQHDRESFAIDFAANRAFVPQIRLRLVGGTRIVSYLSIRPTPLRSIRFDLTNCGSPEITDETRYTSRLKRRWSRIVLLSMCQASFSTRTLKTYGAFARTYISST